MRGLGCGRRAAGIAGALLCALVPAGVAHAAAPYDDLAAAKPGGRVHLAPGLTLTPTQISRSGSTIRVREGRLTIGGVATGRGVRAVATPAGVRIVGGRFGVRRSLTDREYTIPGSDPISVTSAAAGPTAVSGRLAALPPRKQATVRAAADVTEPEVEQALPAPPGGQRWRFGFGLNASGVVVRVFLGDAQVGSGLVRYDGSYRMSMALTDYPVLGAKVSAAGDIAGRSLADPTPVAGLAGRVDGQMQVAKGVSVGDGTVDWDTTGLHVDASAKLACPEGTLAAGAQGTVTSDEDWTFKVAGKTSTEPCAVAENAEITPESIGGELTSTDGDVTGAITAATPPAGSLRLDRNGTSLIGPSLKFTAKGIVVGAGLFVPCPAGGSITATVSATLPYDLKFNDWSATVAAKAGTGGCGVTKELTFASDTDVNVTIGAKNARLGVDLSVQATIKTTLVPTKTYFKVVFKLSARDGHFSSFVLAETDGAGFSGAVKSDGTFDFRFDIDDLQIADAKIVVNGHITRSDPRGKVDIDFQTDVSGNIRLDDNFSIRGLSLGIVGNDLRFGAVIRMQCSDGWYELAADGELLAKGNFRLDIEALAGDCRVGRLVRFNGNTWTGTLSWTDGALDVDIRIAIAEMNLPPIRDKKFGDLDMDLYGTTALITNRCSDGCGPEKLRIDLDGRTKIAMQFPFAPAGVLLDARLRVKLDLDGIIATRFYLGLTDISMNGVKSSLTVELYGDLIRAIGKGLTTKPSPTAPDLPEPDRDLSGAGITERRTPGGVRAMKVAVQSRRARVDVTLTRRSPVTVEIERRACASCRWEIVTFKVVRPDAQKVARFRPSRRLASGSYRAVARVGAAGSGRPVVRAFRVG